MNKEPSLPILQVGASPSYEQLDQYVGHMFQMNGQVGVLIKEGDVFKIEINRWNVKITYQINEHNIGKIEYCGEKQPTTIASVIDGIRRCLV